MAASKRSTSTANTSAVASEAIAVVIDREAARLAGVSEIMLEISESSSVADALSVLRGVVDEVNERISEAARQLRRVGAGHG